MDVINLNGQWNFPIICTFLEVIEISLYSIVDIINEILEKYPNSPIIHSICYSVWIVVASFADTVGFLIYMFECDPGPVS